MTLQKNAIAGERATSARAMPEPMPANVRSIQPGGGAVQAIELAWGWLRRRWLKTFCPGYVAQMRRRVKGDPASCPVEVIDSRDLKYFRNIADCWFAPEDVSFGWRDRLPFARAGLAELMLGCGACIALAAGLASGLAGPRWLAVLPTVLAALVLYFFRDPDRVIPSEPDVVVSPADGTVVEISQVAGHDFLESPSVKIGIFLSICDVHVNRCVMSGQLLRLCYRPGRFRSALRSRSATDNERMELYFEQPVPPYRRFVIHQIAGAVARRIVCEPRPGEILERGQRFGMIKFGSRTELLLPNERFELMVKVGDKVRGGTTRLGRFAAGSKEG